jgi:hypothetical protein
MKPKEYVKKYNLDTSTFIPKGFIEEFADEFIAGVTLLNEKGNFGYERFKVCIEQCKQKYDSICNKSTMTKDTFEKTWKYFYATTVIKLRDAMFGEYLEQKKAAHDKRKKDWEDMHRWENSSFEEMLRQAQEERMRAFFRMLMGASTPTASFEALGLPTTASAEEIKTAYKRLAIEHHPDKGGDEDKFKEILMAKDKCLAYVTKA